MNFTQKKLSAACFIGTTIAMAAYVFLAYFTNSLPSHDANSFLALWSPILLFVLLICLLYSIFAAVKVQGWLKLIPILCILANVLIASVVAFFYVFVNMY